MTPMEIDRYIVVANLAGEATDEQRAALERWRSASPHNEAEFQHQARLWQMLGELSSPELETTPAISAPPTPRRILPLPETSLRPGDRRRRPQTWAVLIAASLLVGIGLGLLGQRWDRGGLRAADVVTGPGEVATLTLQDGTVVRLGPDSRFGFREALGPRDVFLEGQAYFAVPPARDAFRVHTEGGEVRVVGTRFDLQARGAEVRLVVVQGRVEVGAGEQRVSVGPSQMAHVEGAAGPVVQAVDDVYKATEWIGAFVAYESTPLTEVVRELDSRFGLQIEIGDVELESRTVTGWFKDQSPVDMLASLCLAVDARCTSDNGGYRMDLPGSLQPGLIVGLPGRAPAPLARLRLAMLG